MSAPLSEREREVLRLLLGGHDAKSSAQVLGISVHAVNDRLRSARQKLGVTSSREAARIAFPTPERIVHKPLRVVSSGAPGKGRAADARPSVSRPGVTLMIVTAVVGIVAVYAAAPAVPPRVVATSPAQGATVAPGALALRVTFDRPMGAGYSFVHVDAETFPDCAPAPEPSRDRRSFTLRCRVEAGRNYELWFNRAPYMNFRGADGTRAAPYRLRFSAAR